MKEPNTLTEEEKLIFMAGVGYGLTAGLNNPDHNLTTIFAHLTKPFTREFFMKTKRPEGITKWALMTYDKICEFMQTRKPETPAGDTTAPGAPPADPFVPTTAQSIIFNIGLN